ncbi:50S ribosomal protein L6 [Patescibacteria group bacterium]|nr:50S ribosomal protein L6 [Patescibacteria group bacterium]
MSKIGEKPISVKEGVNLLKEDRKLVVKGPKGDLTVLIPQGINISIEENIVKVSRLTEAKKNKALHGTLARLISNAIKGTTEGFDKTLEVVGTGYRAQMEGNTLVLALGYSHPVKYETPEGIKIEVRENKITVLGMDKELVGRVADKIKRFRKPDPYKGKGIRYLGERLKLKPGKAAGKAGVAGGK